MYRPSAFPDFANEARESDKNVVADPLAYYFSDEVSISNLLPAELENLLENPQGCVVGLCTRLVLAMLEDRVFATIRLAGELAVQPDSLISWLYVEFYSAELKKIQVIQGRFIQCQNCGKDHFVRSTANNRTRFCCQACSKAYHRRGGKPETANLTSLSSSQGDLTSQVERLALILERAFASEEARLNHVNRMIRQLERSDQSRSARSAKSAEG
jgi:hypothetical protein